MVLVKCDARPSVGVKNSYFFLSHESCHGATEKGVHVDIAASTSSLYGARCNTRFCTHVGPLGLLRASLSVAQALCL